MQKADEFELLVSSVGSSLHFHFSINVSIPLILNYAVMSDILNDIKLNDLEKRVQETCSLLHDVHMKQTNKQE